MSSSEDGWDSGSDQSVAIQGVENTASTAAQPEGAKKPRQRRPRRTALQASTAEAAHSLNLQLCFVCLCQHSALADDPRLQTAIAACMPQALTAPFLDAAPRHAVPIEAVRNLFEFFTFRFAIINSAFSASTSEDLLLDVLIPVLQQQLPHVPVSAAEATVCFVALCRWLRIDTRIVHAFNTLPVSGKTAWNLEEGSPVSMPFTRFYSPSSHTASKPKKRKRSAASTGTGISTSTNPSAAAPASSGSNVQSIPVSALRKSAWMCGSWAEVYCELEGSSSQWVAVDVVRQWFHQPGLVARNRPKAWPLAYVCAMGGSGM